MAQNQKDTEEFIELVRVEEAQRFSIEDDRVSEYYTPCNRKAILFFIYVVAVRKDQSASIMLNISRTQLRKQFRFKKYS